MELISLYEKEPRDPEKNSFGRSEVSSQHAYETFLVPDWCPNGYPRTFSPPTLNMAAACIWHFLKRFNFNETWYLVIVSEDEFDTFYNAVICDKHIRLLPFWCYCDGGHLNPIGVYRVMIMICLNNRYNWIPYITKEKIENVNDLLNYIKGLTSRNCTCCCSSIHDRKHYNINITLPLCATYILPCLFENGLAHKLDQLINSIIFEDQSLIPYLASSAVQDGKEWKLPVKALVDIPTDLVLPVPKNFKPCSTPTFFVFHFINGRKVYFEQDDNLENSDEKAWIQVQVTNGNVFLNMIENEQIILQHPLYTYLNVAKLFMEENRQLKEEVKRLKENCDLPETKLL